MVKADIEVVMRMSLDEAIALRDDLGDRPISVASTPHYEALDAQIKHAQRILAVA